MAYTIQRLVDNHDCETCGWSCADGYQIYKDGILITDKSPIASCFDSVTYPFDSPYYDIFSLFKIEVKEIDPPYEEDEQE